MLGRHPYRFIAMNKTTPEHDRIQRLFERFGELALEDTEMANDILEDAGMDPEQVAEEGVAFVRQLFEARLRLAAERRAKEEPKITSQLARLTEQLRVLKKDLRTELAQLLSGDELSNFGVQFRNLEELEEEDILNMLAERQVLQLLDKLNASDGNDVDENRNE